ncbi:hypothetical protein E2C01_014240 [Portunus trituberculatus]|uniref:Uncharacterized protein n=1 Tax=Portunus trituberculatus TaxID=210409 RepID=A0A5B7DI99_PORTR|nr:hypothetical protein [Portunus trituberculatus]
MPWQIHYMIHLSHPRTHPLPPSTLPSSSPRPTITSLTHQLASAHPCTHALRFFLIELEGTSYWPAPTLNHPSVGGRGVLGKLKGEC